jgi:hypothetical protein
LGAALGLRREEIVAAARNGFIAAMMPEDERAAALAQFDTLASKLVE